MAIPQVAMGIAPEDHYIEAVSRLDGT